MVTVPVVPLVRSTVITAEPAFSNTLNVFVVKANMPNEKSSSTMVTAARSRPSATPKGTGTPPSTIRGAFVLAKSGSASDILNT